MVYFFKTITDEVRSSQIRFNKLTQTMKITLVSIFACIAALLQAAGGFLPGIGFFLSPLATAPILLSAMFSITLGIRSYLLTIMLLFILQPSELIVFPFTTGLVGLGIGLAFSFYKKRLSVIASGAVLLTLGVTSLLFIFHFPVLGPTVSDAFSYPITICIFLVAFLYSWFWVEITFVMFKRLKFIMIK